MTSFPGPDRLGRGLVVGPGDPVPEPAAGWPRLTIEPADLEEPGPALDRLDAWWRERVPSVVVLAVPFDELKAPQVEQSPPHRLDPGFELTRERLHFLTWVNRYDGREGRVRWHHGERARRVGAATAADGTGDVAVSGSPMWVDGGPRADSDDGLPVTHVETVWSGHLDLEVPSTPPAPSGLAPDQAAAVAHRAGPARVIAPAGSGKTRVLAERMRHLLGSRRWDPGSVTALAYNRRAAGEMAERLADMPGAHVRTLHAFGYEIVGRSRRGRPRLLSEGEARRIVESLAPVRPRVNEDVYAPYLETLAEIRTALRPPEEVASGRDDVPGLVELFDAYRRKMLDQGAMDHDEQVYGAVEALLADPETRAWAQARCRHLLVDELQDLTPAHLLMVRLLAAPAYDVFAVGDDDQLIYGYAGADPGFLLDYQTYFPGASAYQLEVNYRCPAPVVVAAATLLGHNRRRIGKQVRAASEETAGLEVVATGRPEMGGRLVATVEGLVARSAPAEVAVLSRVNVGLLVPQIALGEAGIPAEAALDETLLLRSGVRAALAWLRAADSVARDDQISGEDLSEVARRPRRSLPPGVRTALGRGRWTLERLASFADGSRDDRTHRALRGLVEDLFGLSVLARRGAPLADRLAALRDRVGLGAALDRLDNSRARPGGGHSDDLDALIMLAHTHGEVSDLEPWLRDRLSRAPTPGPEVTLATVHRVKGLEWRHVVVWDASDGLMPHRLATDIEEERRIFHVALTRCSESVIVLGRADDPSPFISEMDGSTAPPFFAHQTSTMVRG